MRRGLIAAILLLAAGAADAQTLAGTVSSRGAPLAGVAVAAEADGRRVAGATTDAQGRFAIDLAAAASARDFSVAFSRAGFRGEVRLLDRAALARPLRVTLLPASGPGAISPDDEARLKLLVTPAGTGPLLFVPYSLQAGGAAPDAAALNERLRLQLQRLIVTHVQVAGSSDSARGVSLTQAPLQADNDLERLRAVGEFVNALAVVSGIGIGDGGTAAPTLELASNYVIIPRADVFDPPVLSIVDTVPAQKIGLLELDQKMSRLWGRATILALAARDLQRAQSLAGEARRAELKRVHAYLKAERANLGARDELSEARLRDLIDRLGREIGP